MKISVVSDAEGRLIGIAPVHDTSEEGIVARVVPADGQYLHELDVEEDFFDDHERIARLHETHRVREGRLIPEEGQAARSS